MRRSIKLQHQLRSVLMICLSLVITISSSSTAVALGFQEPEELTGREEAYRNIIFTGSDDKTPAVASVCAASEGSTGLDISKAFTLGVDPKERRVNLIKAFITEYGLTAKQAAGPVGNFMIESASTETEAHKLPPDVNQGESTGAPPNGSELGYGWAQWSGGRKTAFVLFMNTNGYVNESGHATDAANFAFLKKELSSPSYRSTITELKKQTSPENAAVSFEATFERAGSPVLDKRKAAAKQAYEEYTQTKTDAGSSLGDDCGEIIQSVDFGEVSFPLKGPKTVVKNPAMFSNGDTSQGGHPYISYDIMSPGGTPIRAFIGGKVSYMFNDTCGGDSVVIWNADKKIAISYMHMNTGDVIPKMGESVRVGQVIGKVGAWYGGCGGDHLHIDASTDRIRQACSRSGCPENVKKTFRSMGKPLYDAFQTLPDK